MSFGVPRVLGLHWTLFCGTRDGGRLCAFPFVTGPASVIAYCPQSLCYPSKLASLRLVRYPLSPLRQPLPLLRELRINSTQSLGNYFTILDLCPQLEVLEVACKLSPSSGNQPIRIAPRLHTFVFVGSYESAGSSLDYIHLPAIQLLSVTFNTIGWIPSYGAHLVDFLTRCGLDLQELRLSTPHISSEILVQCLQCVPNINTLCLISQMIDEAFVEAFTVPLNDCSGLCPRLEYLEFDTRQRLATSLIASMIASRWRFHGGQRVARPLAVGLFPVIQEVSNRAEVRKCIQAGLKIYEYNSNGKWWALSL
ncbi:hypothetical protein BD410DRAFT_109276 [Rickenella mellea]|uniref:F-box domain-containing protein n=1 Tax=Rickenella mellea TaxID=50990 RepID=A0A4Y7QA18_9AGAM|nr:hypothetical protein BD410DRAFT_109276 [Rickenella mellea]